MVRRRRASSPLRSEWTMPPPAVIQLTSPGAILQMAAEAVAMHDRAFEQIRHGREPDMRMRAHVEPSARRERRRAEMVEENEWSDHARLAGR